MKKDKCWNCGTTEGEIISNHRIGKKCEICAEITNKLVMRKETIRKRRARDKRKAQLIKHLGKAGCEDCGVSVDDLPIFCFSFYNKNSEFKLSFLLRKYEKNKNEIMRGIVSANLLCSNCWRNRRNKQENIHSRNNKIDLANRLGSECSHCKKPVNDKNHRMFVFHHLDAEGKKFNLSEKISDARDWNILEHVEEEVSKCILLCSNCHDIEHNRLVESERNFYFCSLQQQLDQRKNLYKKHSIPPNDQIILFPPQNQSILIYY